VNPVTGEERLPSENRDDMSSFDMLERDVTSLKRMNVASPKKVDRE
jgi:hypothetical protein